MSVGCGGNFGLSVSTHLLEDCKTAAVKPCAGARPAVRREAAAAAAALGRLSGPHTVMV
jgi:hypothetical protein